MPYRQANYFVGFTLLVILVGFWGSYFSPIAKVPHAFHVHAFTATSWVALLMFQIWSIHNGRRHLHRLAGMLSLVLFPFLIVGFVMIINVSAESFAANVRPNARFLGPSFGLSMLFAILAYLILYYQALRNRRNVKLHAGYMLTTPLVLFESPFSRVMLDHFPFVVFTGSEFPQRTLDAIAISMAMAIAFSVVMYLRDRKSGVPFLLAAILMLLQAVTMYVGTSLEWVRQGFTAYAGVPATVTVLGGFLLGAAVSWLGWNSVERSVRPVAQAPAAS
jgi:hypothetical protein